MKGRKRSQEARDAISRGKTGKSRKPFSVEHKRKLSEAAKRQRVREKALKLMPILLSNMGINRSRCNRERSWHKIMVAYIFEPILQKGMQSNRIPNLSADSSTWYRNQAKKIAVANPQTMLKNDRSRLMQFPMIGRMYLFAYDPKHKKTLPYYDRFPLIIPVDTIKTSGRLGGDGFMGINLHYLPLILRAKLMDALYQYASDEQLNENTRLKISYNILQSVSKLKYFKPCLKQYLFSHVRSRFFLIDPTEWNIALFLPLDRFVKADKNVVYKDSRSKI